MGGSAGGGTMVTCGRLLGAELARAWRASVGRRPVAAVAQQALVAAGESTLWLLLKAPMIVETATSMWIIFNGIISIMDSDIECTTGS